jgi:hypothetical protein
MLWAEKEAMEWEIKDAITIIVFNNDAKFMQLGTQFSQLNVFRTFKHATHNNCKHCRSVDIIW